MIGSTVIACVSSFEAKKIRYWYEYHKTKCPNVRMIQNIPYMSDTEEIKNPDISITRYPSQVPYMVYMSMLCGLEREKFDYFVFMEHDAFILGDWLSLELRRMKDNHINCLVPNYQYKKEHRKEFAYGYISQKFAMKPEDYIWTLSNCYIMDRLALRMFNELYDPFLGYEVGVVNTLRTKCKVDENKYIDIKYNRSNCIRVEELGELINGKNKNYVIHAVKDYDVVRRITGFRVRP